MAIAQLAIPTTGRRAAKASVYVCLDVGELLYGAWSLPTHAQHTNRTLLLNLTAAESCSSDADCGAGFYCSSKKVCIKYTGDVCNGISCGLGDGGSCIFSPLLVYNHIQSTGIDERSRTGSDERLD